MLGAELIIDCLEKEKVEVIFGYPGGAVLDLFDALYKTKAPIRFILTRHEQGAAHAADGYARATGKVGVCLATSGPGATNLVTGIATAYMDSIPMVAITGQVPTPMIGNDAFQEADITGITRPITKHNYLVRNADELPQVIREAFYIASTGRPGPVLIDIPKDVQRTSTDAQWPKTLEMRGYKPTYEGHIKQIEKLSQAIHEAHRPVLYVGGGAVISDAYKELKELVDKTDIPVTTTLLGMGAFPDTHPLSLKMLGMHGTRYANLAVMEADLIISVGARFDDRVTGKVSEFAPHAKIAHIDIDPTSISKSIRVDIPVVGDAKKILAQLNKIVKKGDYADWIKKVESWKKEYPLTYGNNKELKPQYVVEQIYEVTKGKAIICTEVGQNQMWAAQFYKYTHPRTFISSGGLGTMGYGFPASIGAKVGCPNDIVFDIAGDGSFQMNIQELATAVANDIQVKVAILNNQYLGMVRQWQELFYGHRYSGTCLAKNITCPPKCSKPVEGCPQLIPDFVKVAEAYGAVGICVEKKKDVTPAIKKAISTPRPVIIDFRVAKEENVFPMVPAGASLTEMIGGLA